MKYFKNNKKIQEGVASHSESINQLADQVKKFILKHKDNANAAVNSLSIGLFIGASEAFAEDGDPNTNGLNMLDKIMTKVKILMKTYDDLVPDEGQEFDLTPEDEEEMQTTLETDEDSEDDDESEADEIETEEESDEDESDDEVEIDEEDDEEDDEDEEEKV